MKLIFFGILTAVLVSSACKNNEDTTTEDIADTAAAVTDSTINCYKYADVNDTISMVLITKGEAVSGTLIYLLQGKDRNTGTIAGTLKGDLLVANYQFTSEGSTSNRQVAFKKIDNYFVEGYGEPIFAGDSYVYKNLDSLQFDVNFRLSEIPCE